MLEWDCRILKVGDFAGRVLSGFIEASDDGLTVVFAIGVAWSAGNCREGVSLVVKF